MNLRKWITPLATLGLMATIVAAPVSSFAQYRDGGYRYQQHRANERSTWNNLAVAGAAVGVLGLATHNDTLGVLGLAGAAYSAYRSSQDGANCARGYGYGYGEDYYGTTNYAFPYNETHLTYGPYGNAYSGGWNNDNCSTDYGYSNYGRRDYGYKTRYRSISQRGYDWRNGR